MGMPTVISLFAGCGGSSLGYRLAGFRELLAIDFDDNSVETFKLNFPEVPVWKRDIRSVTGAEIMALTGIGCEELDVLDGSPPCQGFSTAGRRKVSDSRNDLFKECTRLINELRPKAFIIENVSGMVSGRMRGIFIDAIKSFKSTGYKVRCRMLNSENYGVPQSRKRIFFIGVRPDIGRDPVFPKPNASTISAGKATEGLSEKTCIWLDPGWYTYGLWDEVKIGKSLFASGKFGNSGYSFIKVDPNRPSPTIPKSLEIGNRRWGGHIHWSEKRSLSIEEVKRLCSFPDDFRLTGSIQQQWARLGNAVMPNQMKAIAETVRKEVLEYGQ